MTRGKSYSIASQIKIINNNHYILENKCENGFAALQTFNQTAQRQGMYD